MDLTNLYLAYFLIRVCNGQSSDKNYTGTLGAWIISTVGDINYSEYGDNEAPVSFQITFL